MNLVGRTLKALQQRKVEAGLDVLPAQLASAPWLMPVLSLALLAGTIYLLWGDKPEPPVAVGGVAGAVSAATATTAAGPSAFPQSRQTVSEALARLPVMAKEVRLPASAVAIDKTLPQVLLPKEMAAVREQLAKTPTQEASDVSSVQLLEQARSRLKNGDDIQALQALEHYLLVSANKEEARKRGVSLMLKHGMEDEAAVWLQEGMEQSPKDKTYARQMETLLARKGKKGNANNAAVVREERPAEMNAAQHMLLAQTARRSGALDEAVGHYQSALQQGLPAEDEAKSLVGLGLALDAQGRREDARQMYIRALNHPGLPDAMREPTQIAVEAMSPKSTTPVASE